MDYASINGFGDVLLLSFLGNTLEQYLLAIGIFLFSYLLVRIFVVKIKKYLQRWINKDKKRDSLFTVLLSVVNNIPRYFLRILVLYLPLQTLVLASWLSTAVDYVFIVLLWVQIILALIEILDYFMVGMISLQGEVGSTTKNVVSLTTKIVVRIIGGLLILMNLGIEITPLIASLGLGGIAIAFALKNILEDIFSSFSILFDRPFKVGDFVNIDGESGTVKRISLKSTRIKTVAGQILILPNKKVMEASINNFAGIKKRRVKQMLGVTYETSYEMLKKIPEICEEIVTGLGEERTRFLWTTFKDYGPYSLDFQLSYYTKADTYKDHLAILQDVNLGIFEAFEKHGISFAYPTQKLFVDAQEGRMPSLDE